MHYIVDKYLIRIKEFSSYKEPASVSLSRSWSCSCCQMHVLKVAEVESCISRIPLPVEQLSVLIVVEVAEAAFHRECGRS